MEVRSKHLFASGCLALVIGLIAGCNEAAPATGGDDVPLAEDAREPAHEVDAPSDHVASRRDVLDAEVDAKILSDALRPIDASADEDASHSADAEGGDSAADEFDGRSDVIEDLGGDDGGPSGGDGEDRDVAEDEADSASACVCTEGPCCDGCQLLPADTICRIGDEHGCPWGTHCGSAVAVRELRGRCSGRSAGCVNGPLEVGPWREASACPADTYCVRGQSACVSSPTCPCPEGMVHVPESSFPMGSQPGEGNPSSDGEYPQHEVHVQPYCIDRHEVTTADYVEFLNDAAPDDNCGEPWPGPGIRSCVDWGVWMTPDGEPDVIGLSPRPPVEWTGPPSGTWTVGESCQPEPHAPPLSDCSSHPITFVTWWGAREYCAWAGKRLPSGAEWERTCKGTTDRQYAWGDEAVFEGRTNCGESLCADGFDYLDEEYNQWYQYPSPIGTFPRDLSPAGAYDMAGNVSEWVEDDYFGSYEGAPVDGSAWTAAESGGQSLGKVIRGGDIYRVQSWGIRCARRGAAGGSGGSDNRGFRCAWSPGSPPRRR